MNNNHSENSNIKQVSFIDLWRVLARYYYVILMAVVISLGSVLLYIQGNSGKLRYVSKVIIESSSYYDVNDGTYYQMFLPFTDGVKNSEFLDLFFSYYVFCIYVNWFIPFCCINRIMNTSISKCITCV